MSLDGIEKWAPYIDENGVLRPTDEEQYEMLRRAHRSTALIKQIVSVAAIVVLGAALFLV